MKDICRHELAQRWLTVPLDVKTGRPTRFGELNWCPACQKGFSVVLPNARQIATHYELPSYYTQGASHIPKKEPVLVDRILTRIAWTFDRGRQIGPERLRTFVTPPGDAVDIGSGGGSLLRSLRDMGFNAIGVEPDPLARRHAMAAGLTVLDGTAEALPMEIVDRKFALVTATHVLEHCVRPEEALQSVVKLLAEDGLLYCEVPNCGSLYFRKYAQISEMLDVPRHLHFFTKASLASLAAACGLSILDWHYHGFTRHFSRGWCDWENGIRERLGSYDIDLVSPRRSLAGSLALLIRAAGVAAERKYDSIGFFARRR